MYMGRQEILVHIAWTSSKSSDEPGHSSQSHCFCHTQNMEVEEESDQSLDLYGWAFKGFFAFIKGFFLQFWECALGPFRLGKLTW